MTPGRRETRAVCGWLPLIVLCIHSVIPSAFAADPGEFKPYSVLGVFLGATDADGYSTEFTYGLEASRRFSERFGVGVVYEKTDEGHGGIGTTVALGNLYYSPFGEWRLGAGVGKEKVDGHGDKSSHTENLYRLGVAYHFHLGKFGLAPMLNVDFVDGDCALVYGFAIARLF